MMDFENRELRICGPNRDEIVGGWRKLHNKRIHNFHSSPNNNGITKSMSIG
jgi:hypothetical protein